MGEPEALKYKEEGNAAFKSGNWDSAAKLYTKAINLETSESRDLSVFLKNRAAAYLKLGKFEEALSDCDRSLEIVPRDPKALFRRCQALEALERFEEAYRDATQIFKDDPNNRTIQPVLERLYRIVQERVKENAQTSTKIESMTKLAFDLAADREKRETAMNNLLVLARENAGSSLMIKSPVVQQIKKLLKVEKNREICVTGIRIIGELCKHNVDKTRSVMKDVGIPWFLEILDSNHEQQVNAAQYCIQQILNIFSGMDNKTDSKPDQELVQKNKKDIDMILTCLVYSINNQAISGLARDAIIELLTRNIHYTALNWAEQLVEIGGVSRLMECASELEEYKYESAMNITPSTRTIAAVCLSRIYENMYYDAAREKFMTKIQDFIKDKLLTPDIESKVRVAVAITALLRGPLDVGNAIIGKEGIMEMILVMANTDDLLQQKVACECIVAAASKADKAKAIIAQGVNILKTLYKSKDDAIRVRALVGLCKLGSSGGTDAAKKPFAEGSNLKLAEACRRFLVHPGNDADIRKWAAEGLSYLTLDAEVKEKLVEDRPALQSLIELAKTGDQSCLFGVVTTLVNLCNAYEKQEIIPEMVELAKFAKQHIPEEHELGRIWTMVAGGGASVIYSDTICDLGGAKELANYGEYSGAPSEQQTYEYAKTILSLMTQEKHPQGKVLITGGGIANFTNVAATFRGIITALVEFQQRLIEHKVSIFVRRAGPNYQEGLRRMREVGQTLGIPLYVFGPETHMTAICGMALGTRPIPQENNVEFATANFLLPSGEKEPNKKSLGVEGVDGGVAAAAACSRKIQGDSLGVQTPMFTNKTKSIVWGMQTRAVQSMLDFDFVCSRPEPSVVAIIYPFTGDHKQKFYWGHKEILIPVYKKMNDAMTKHPEADVLVNFASLRSAYQSTVETMEFPQIRTIAIIAEGIPENQTRKLIKLANEKKVAIIGPATVGGVKPGCFKIGNTGGMMDNILHSKLYRPGSVAYVSRSGGMSNELNNIVSKATDGVYEGVAIGGDRYPGTTFMDHIMRYQGDENVKMIILLGEVGGVEEYEVCNALKNKIITKPLVAWCIGTCAGMFTSEVQFGHAGSCANSNQETATAKNEALKAAGAHVPASFDYLGEVIQEVYEKLVIQGVIIPRAEVPPPTVPMDYSWARELGLIRKPASFMTSICDERGQELIYAGMPISDVLQKNVGIGGVISLLWFQRCLPTYVCKFFEMCLMVTADHGPAVSGAHNTIVCARAGKDLVSSLVSGLLTIGDRFGGALDGAAKQFSEAYDTGMHPAEFVNHMRNKGQLIMGIGHRVKSINNPDQRVKIVKEFVMANFPATPLLLYALEVEKITTSKKPNLILNVDGVIACSFVDMLRNCGSFTSEEAQEYINIGAINSLFVLGRSIGFIGHFMDQKRLKQGLYRHPWDDISYVLPEQYNN